MSMSRHVEVPSIGLFVNFSISISLGFLFWLLDSPLTVDTTNSMIVGLAVALVTQEVILIQYLSNDANVAYQNRLLNGVISIQNRRLMLLLPFFSIFMLGILFFLLSPLRYEHSLLFRIFCISIIIMLGIDPLFGLIDRGILAVFGAAVVYLIVLQTGFAGYGGLANAIENIIDFDFAFPLALSVLCYLLLSTRWTYYRLFCFNQIDNLGRVLLDTGFPLFIVLLPHMPTFFEMVEHMYLG